MQGQHQVILVDADQQADRTSAPIDTSSHRGIILRVKVGTLTGTPTYTPRLEMKNMEGGWDTIWTAAAGIAAAGTKLYALGPGATDVAGYTEAVEMLLPGRVRVVIAGGTGVNHANTQADAWLVV